MDPLTHSTDFLGVINNQGVKNPQLGTHALSK